MNYYFAPMEGITGYIYRNAHFTYFPETDRYFMPFVAANQTHRFRARETADLLPEHNGNMPVVPQILAGHAEEFVCAARRIEEYGYKEINLNLGCSVPTISRKKRGAGFLAYPDELDRFLNDLFEELRNDPVKISVKTRIGYDAPDEAARLFQIYEQYPLSELIVHPRTRADLYEGHPNLEVFAQILHLSRHKIIYNGDLKTAADCRLIEEKFPSVSGVMIGRGLVRNPALIRQAKGGVPLSLSELRAFHDEVYRNYQGTLPGGNVIVNRMKELWKYMSTLFPNCDKERKAILKASNKAEYEAAVRVFFTLHKKINL